MGLGAISEDRHHLPTEEDISLEGQVVPRKDTF